MRKNLFVLLLTILAIIIFSCSSEEEKVSVIGITLDKDNMTLTEGQSELLSYNITPSDADDKSVTWKSSEENIASVVEGKVTAIKKGEATISVITNDGYKTARCHVTVTPKFVPVTKITLQPQNLEIFVGAKGTISASVSPEDATDKTIEWKSSDEKVVTVSNGEVTGIAEGKAIIYASSGEISESCSVSVKKVEVTEVEINPETTSINVGDSIKLSATVLPENATYPDVTWTSSNTEIATINGTGVVFGLKEGTTKIKAIADNVSSRECVVEVRTVPVQKITLDRASADLLVDESIVLSVTIEPYNATDKTVDWLSTNGEVAYVRNGKVVAMNVGTTTIKAQTSDGRISATCNVTVGKRPKLPIEYVSQYNLKSSKVFSESHSCQESGYFSWQNAQYASPSGYHIPSVAELTGVFGDLDIMKLTGYDFNSFTSGYVTENITFHRISASYQAAYYCNSNGVLYAIKFKGMGEELRSAYRYEYVKDMKYLRVTVRYLGKAFKGTLEDIADDTFWNIDNRHDIIRIFPACGGYTTGNVQGNPGYGVGRYWTSDEFQNANPKTIGNYLFFNSDLLQMSLPSMNDKTGKFTVRPFSDN